MRTQLILSAIVLTALSAGAKADLTNPATTRALPLVNEEEAQPPQKWHDLWPGDGALHTDTPAATKSSRVIDRKPAGVRRAPSRLWSDRVLGTTKSPEPPAPPAPTPSPTPDRGDDEALPPIGLGDPIPGTNPVPAPGAFLLGALGLAGVNWLKRRGL
jgi:hypothetical protein